MNRTPAPHLGFLLLLFSLPLFSGGIAADEGLLTRSQRTLFLAAEKALRNNDRELFQTLKKSLAGYPLHPYLEYQQLRKSLDRADADEVAEFLERHADTPLAGRLRKHWLDLLASRKDWRNYVRFYRPDHSVTRQCHHLNALLHTGKKQEALDKVQPLWLHGRSRPSACDPVFAAWREAGRLTPELVWRRFELAMDKGQVKLAKYLRKLLPPADRPWAELWIRLRGKPERALTSPRLAQPHPMRGNLLTYAVRRKATLDPLGAIELWENVQKKYSFTALEKHLVNRRVAERLTREPDPAAWAFLRQVEPCSHDTRLQEARLRAALYRQRWDLVADWIDRMPADQQQSERWRYWKARALEQTGRRGEAVEHYRELAKERSFYGFLAADHIGAPYNLNHEPVPVEEALLARVAADPGVQRARELVALERWPDARREWRLATAHMEPSEIMAAARVAQSWNWRDQAIFTLARSGYWEDLELRFPLEHRDQVKKHAGRRGLDVSWVFGLIRQESAFNPAVRSHVGAMGLMQLMPATARYVARKLLKRKKAPNRRALSDPATNIELGTTYLSDVLERMEQNPVLATAAYNAGPHRVSRWLPEQPLSADIWIESIPFRETRRYVKRVFTYAVIYDHRLGREVARLSERLQPIGGTSLQRTAQQEHNHQATL